MVTSPVVDAPSVSRCVGFLDYLPYRIPEPFVAIGDDGSIGLEWDRGDKHLYVSFSPSGDEFYWSEEENAEYEGALPAAAERLIDSVRALLEA